MATLPPIACNGCRKCCIGDEILLMEGDDPTRFKTKLRGDGRRVVARKKNGNCVYLGPRGCTIQAAKPRMCKAYDCRLHALAVQKMSPEDQAPRLRMIAVQEGFRRLQEAT